MTSLQTKLELDFFPEDRRPKPRVRLRLPVRLYYKQFRDYIAVFTNNLSESGMYVEANSLQQAGTLFEFQIQLTDRDSLIEGTGEVVWVKAEKGLAKGMGVRFLKLSGESLDFLRRVVADRLSDGSAQQSS